MISRRLTHARKIEANACLQLASIYTCQQLFTRDLPSPCVHRLFKPASCHRDARLFHTTEIRPSNTSTIKTTISAPCTAPPCAFNAQEPQSSTTIGDFRHNNSQ